MDVVKEALLHYRSMWAMWLELKHTTDAERELARLKIALIDAELNPSGPTLRPTGNVYPAFNPPEGDYHAFDPTTDLIRCANQGCGETIQQNENGTGWVHVETGNAYCDVPPRNPAYGKRANPLA
ncbi:gp51 [Mycobacterium phage Predator]|uniref:Uncharacterized protein n=1 Tax=Mycobacterium phage Predator TaxID=543153 RepID=B3VM78_9CAUD|nr:gp51 [Mycobacterium phage Predator]ACF05148.1 hypothetical protein PREDATOR_51 [Mycobacterium phage Predator]